MPAHTITPLPPLATQSTTLTSANRSPSQRHTYAVCHLPCTGKTGIHPWREHLSKVPGAIKCEHLPTQVGYDNELQSGRDPDEDDEHEDELPWDSFWQFVQKSLCQPIVAAAVQVVCLRQSWRWKCWMWRSWAGVVTRGLKLWGQLDVLPNSLKCLWRWLMVEKWTFNSRSTVLVDIPAVRMPIACSLKTCNICGIVLCDKTAHFRVAFYCVQPKSHLCNNLDMPHLWGGCIISAKEKCSLTQI